MHTEHHNICAITRVCGLYFHETVYLQKFHLLKITVYTVDYKITWTKLAQVNL